MKQCTRCETVKPLDQFRRGQGYKNGIRAECKACEAARLARWRQKHPQQTREQYKRNNDSRRVRKIGYYDPDPQVRDLVKLRVRNAYLIRKYGITLDDELGMLEAQDYRCAACGDSIAEGHHVDHCHIGGFVRALLCGRCNVVLGAAEDSPEVLRKLAAYAESYNRPNPILTDP